MQFAKRTRLFKRQTFDQLLIFIPICLSILILLQHSCRSSYTCFNYFLKRIEPLLVCLIIQYLRYLRHQFIQCSCFAHKSMIVFLKNRLRCFCFVLNSVLCLMVLRFGVFDELVLDYCFVEHVVTILVSSFWLL